MVERKKLKNELLFTQKQLKEVLRYYPITGNFRWVKQIGKRSVPWSIAGTTTVYQYIRIVINGKIYMAHRLAFLYMTGKFPINYVDHEDHNRSNNIWSNLKQATRQSNGRNITLPKNNISGTIGVCWRKQAGKWTAQIYSKEGRAINLGVFKKKKEAIKARKDAEKKYGYHPNHGKRKRVQLVIGVA